MSNIEFNLFGKNIIFNYYATLIILAIIVIFSVIWIVVFEPDKVWLEPCAKYNTNIVINGQNMPCLFNPKTEELWIQVHRVNVSTADSTGWGV